MSTSRRRNTNRGMICGLSLFLSLSHTPQPHPTSSRSTTAQVARSCVKTRDHRKGAGNGTAPESRLSVAPRRRSTIEY
jgi:hypothetical protein